MTAAERNNISNPADGLIIFNTTSNSLNIFYSGAWQQLTNTTPTGTIATLTVGVPTGNLVWGVAASGVSSEFSYTGGNGEKHSGQTVSSTGVTGLTATLSAAYFAVGNGSLTYNITGTPSSIGTASFAINIGSKTATLTRTIAAGSISSLTTGTTDNGTLMAGTAASGVSSVVSYTGGDGGSHSGQIVNSTGVTGLTATLSAGSFASGNGTLTYNITGTPSGTGTASFALNIGGRTATLTRTVSGFACGTATVTFTYRGSAVTYETVVGAAGRCWLARNLGATQVATSSYDANGFGDYFQWGRGDDGHQIKTSLTTATLSGSDNPGNGNFITSSSDWRSPRNDNLWQGVSGTNNPCPSGWRLPTESEWVTEKNSWSSQNTTGAINSALKLTVPGNRSHSDGSMTNAGWGFYWTSTTSSSFATYLQLGSSSITTTTGYRGIGGSVRCIRN